MYLSIIFSSVPLLASFNKLIIVVINTEVYNTYTQYRIYVNLQPRICPDSLPSSVASLLLYSEFT